MVRHRRDRVSDPRAAGLRNAVLLRVSRALSAVVDVVGRAASWLVLGLVLQAVLLSLYLAMTDAPVGDDQFGEVTASDEEDFSF